MSSRPIYCIASAKIDYSIGGRLRQLEWLDAKPAYVGIAIFSFESAAMAFLTEGTLTISIVTAISGNM